MACSIARGVGLTLCLAPGLLVGCSSPDDATETGAVPDTTVVVSTTISATTTTTGGTSATVTSLLAAPVLDLGLCTGVVPVPDDASIRGLADALQDMCDAANLLADAVSRSPSFDAGWGRHPDIQTAAAGLVDAGDRIEAVVGSIVTAFEASRGPAREFLDELQWSLSGSELTLKHLPALLDAQSGEMVEEFWNLGHVGIPTFLDYKIAQFGAMLAEDPTLEGWFHPCFGLTMAFNGPAEGWIVTSPTLDLGIEGSATPDGITVGSQEVPIVHRNHWWDSSTSLQLTEGVNEVPVTVICDGRQALSVTVPITYLPDAEVRLADAVSATSDAITLDWLRWDDSGEFPGPVDDDPGITETLPVSEDPVFWLGFSSNQPEVDYEWLVNRIESGEPVEPWGPYYPYWVTISEGVVVQLEMQPLG